MGLVARSGLLPQHSSGARALAVRVLQEKNIVPRMDLERQKLPSMSQEVLLYPEAKSNRKERGMRKQRCWAVGCVGNAAAALQAHLPHLCLSWSTSHGMQ